MHLQVRSKLTDSGTGPGAQSASESVDGVTDASPGRLARLLWLLAQDRRSDPDDGHGPFNLVAATGSNIETTGEFAFAVAASEADDDAEHAAALRRISREFRRSWIVERVHADIPHREGELLKFIAGFADQGLLIDEVVVGVASCELVDGRIECTVPVQVHAIRPRQP